MSTTMQPDDVAEATVEPQEPTGDGEPAAQSPEPTEASDRRGDAPSWAEIRRLREEAGKRRHALREVEAERDRLRDRVEAADRAEVERLLADRLVDPSDIWSNGVQLSDLHDDEGNLDAEKVTEAAAKLIERKPHFATAGTDFHGGVRQPVPRAPSFGSALKRRLTGA